MAGVTTVGLDIGSVSIRAVQVSRTRNGPVVTNVGQALLPHGAVRGGVIHDDKAVTLALRQLWSTAKFRTRTVSLAVTHPQVMVREMAVTNLPDKELRQSLPFQVRELLPLPVERTLLDFIALEQPGRNPTVRGLVIAAPKEAVLAAVQTVERAGLQVERVDLASFALLRAGARLDGLAEAIVDIGASTTSVVVHVGGTPLIVRSLPRGGAEVTETIAAQLETSVHEAESLKRRVGLQPDGEYEAAHLIREAVRPLVNEIRSSFAYLTTAERPIEVTRLVLSGGGAQLPGLAEMLRRELHVEVGYADPAVRLHGLGRGTHDTLDRFRASAAVSIGLTLGAAA